MGTGSADTLTEIEQIRARIDQNLAELERRLPAPVRLARRVVAVAVGGGVGASLLWFAVRRLRPQKASQEPASGPVVVNVVPRGLVPVALAAVAAWAGVRVYDLRLRGERAGADEHRPAALRSMPGRAGMAGER